MTIDPGISGTGYAIFNKRKLIDYGNIYPKKAKTFTARAASICHRTIGMARLHGCVAVWCEWPSNFMGSKKGIAAFNSNSIIKLAYLIGRINERWGFINMVQVQRWKGQLPKEVTRKRAERFFKRTGFKSHAADAVGIGQWVLENKLI